MDHHLCFVHDCAQFFGDHPDLLQAAYRPCVSDHVQPLFPMAGMGRKLKLADRPLAAISCHECRGGFRAIADNTSYVTLLDVGGPFAMHIHLPKPLHGWRALVGEIGIIVVGVLIALSAEQFAEFVHDRAQVRHGEEALRDNFRRFVTYTAELDAYAPCITARSAELRQLIDRSSVTHQLPNSVLFRRSKLVPGRSTHMTRWSLRRRSRMSLMGRPSCIRVSRCPRSTFMTMQRLNGRTGESLRASADHHAPMMMRKKRRIGSSLLAPFTRTR